MGRIRRSFDISFKIRVCEAIDRGERTVLEVCWAGTPIQITIVEFSEELNHSHWLSTLMCFRILK